jgi:hypothetical protein
MLSPREGWEVSTSVESGKRICYVRETSWPPPTPALSVITPFIKHLQGILRMRSRYSPLIVMPRVEYSRDCGLFAFVHCLCILPRLRCVLANFGLGAYLCNSSDPPANAPLLAGQCRSVPCSCGRRYLLVLANLQIKIPPIISRL